MNIFIQAIKIYKKYGFDIKTGLNPYHFGDKYPLYLPFTFLYKGDKELDTGGDFAG